MLSNAVQSQEILLPLGSNPQLNKSQQARKQYKSAAEAIKLPFIDDFSNYTLYPDSNLWADNYVFINTQYAIYPPSIGVATFDALNQAGTIYPNATVSQFSADTLTSQPIRLDSVFSPVLKAIKPSDSLYFSFYYQPGGGRGAAWERIGDAPEADDSLVLEFYAPLQQTWNRIWSTKGVILDSIYKHNNQYFKYVLLSVNDTARYYKNGFRFRFRNYSSLGNNIIPSWSGNCDQWNLDYVYLGINRSKTDTARKDLSFVEKAPSFLKYYEAMPASQFISSELKDSLRTIQLTNLDNVAHASSYKYEIRDPNGTLLTTYNGGFSNIDPYVTNGFQTYNFHSRPPVDFTFPQAVGNKTHYEIRHIFKEGIGQDFRVQNDTNIFIQNFQDYYAYDDGTAENGYGLTPAGSKLAYQFNLNNPDTLVAVKIFFNSTFNNSNLKYIRLTIWNDNNNKPGDTIYSSNPIMPLVIDEFNKYQTFFLDRLLPVNGKIYVGMVQSTDDNMNIGFDRNTSSESRIFYNSSGSWNQSFLKGSLMIRPVFGVEFLGINNLEKDNFAFNIYPNPLKNNNLNINLQTNNQQQNNNFIIQIFDILGNNIYQSTYKNEIDVSHISNGVYFVKISNLTTKSQVTKKLIISR